jgi:hypothetical protein
MKLGIVQMTAAVTIIVLAMLTPLVPSFDSARGSRRPGSSEPAFGAYSSALAQDDNDDDDDEDNDDDDNEDEDNEDDDADNEDEDNEDDDADNEDEDNEDDDADNEDEDNEDDDAEDDDGDADNDDGDVGDSGDDGASFTFDASVTEASGTSTGGDSRIGLPSDRILVQVFPWMPQGVGLTIRLLSPSTTPAPPCTVVGDLLFQLEAHDGGGAALTQLPAEVNLSARYTNEQVSGLSRRDATLLWLDPADNQWKTAPKLVTSPSTHYVAASVTGSGAYAVCIS